MLAHSMSDCELQSIYFLSSLPGCLSTLLFFGK